MDNNDKKLLYFLDKDARLSYSQLAKLTRMSQETVRYRINNMIKNGVIKKFVTIINSVKLGIVPYQLFLKMQNIDEESKGKMIDSIKDDHRIAWIANTEGRYDLAIIIAAKNLFDFQEIIKKVYRLLKKQIIKKDISVHISTEFFSRDYLIGKRRENISDKKYFPEDKTIKLDKIDTQICVMLANDGKISFVDIASKAGLSADAIAQRVKKLKKDGIISGSIAVLNQEKISSLYYKILLYFNDLSEDKINSLLNHIRLNNRVLAIVQTLAEWDYEIDIEIEHPNQLREFIMKLTKEFPGIIKDYETIRIIDMPKYNFIP